MTNLVADLEATVRERPDATAISVAGRDTTYAEFWAMTGRFAGALRERGFEPGASVALYLPNLPQFVVAFYGVLRAGGTVVPIDPRSGADEIRHPLTDGAAVAVVTTRDRVPRIEEIHEHTILRFMVTADGPGQYSTGFSEFLAEGTDALDYWEVIDREDDDVAVVPYTADATGQPRGVELTHGNVASTTETAAELVPDGLGPDDAALGALPLAHVYGMTVVTNAVLASGGTLHPLAEWDAGEAMSLIDIEDLTVFHGVPAMYDDMVTHPDADQYDLSSLRLAGAVGSGASPELLTRFEETFDVTVSGGYGPTEACSVTHFDAPESGRRVGSVGKPAPGVDARIVDDDFEDVGLVEEGPVDDADFDGVTGEIVVAGPNVMKRYHDAPEANDEAFTGADGRRWFHTGDVGYRDEDDYYYVVDRQDDGDADDPADGTGANDDDVGVTGDDGAETADDDAATSDDAGTDSDDGAETAGGDAASDLRSLDGISESRAATLREAGYESVADLRAASREDLTAVEGFGDALVDRIESQLRD